MARVTSVAMAEELPVVCSLEAGDLEQRLDEVARLGADALLGSDREGDMHLLRFRSDPGVGRRLREVIAAEARCCAFLELSLVEEGDELLLSISAPAAGGPTADALASAFEAA
jgi:hypothetical protein